VRCDFLILMAKLKLTAFVGALAAGKTRELERALRIALALD
jgi:hypothetical protein